MTAQPTGTNAPRPHRKIVTCIDCGAEFERWKSDQTRCSHCRRQYRNERPHTWRVKATAEIRCQYPDCTATRIVPATSSRSTKYCETHAQVVFVERQRRYEQNKRRRPATPEQRDDMDDGRIWRRDDIGTGWTPTSCPVW